LPAVKGADDAEEAQWFPLADVLSMGEKLFEDHLSIIQAMSARAQ
jgi:bifunctional NMN adenylyltransferase/nudix hydrolase